MPRVGLDVKFDEWTGELRGDQFVACARAAEDAGFDTIWTNEDIGYDSFALLAAAATHTERIGLGTAIVNVYARSAMQIAMGAATVDELSSGRVMLGLGVGHHPWNDEAHGIPIEAPIARMREYVTFIAKALTGDDFTHEGRAFHGVHSRLAFAPVRARVPIFVAGTGRGRQLVALAARVADGLMMNVVTAEQVARSIAPRWRDTASRAGRDPSSLELMAVVTCCVDDDAALAFADARRMFAYRVSHFAQRYARGLDSLERFRAIWPAEHGEEIERLVSHAVAGDGERVQREASRPIVAPLVPHGTPDEVASQLERYFAAGCTRLAVAIYPRGLARLERAARLLMPWLRRVNVEA